MTSPPNVFSDLVEGGRTLSVNIRSGMVYIQLSGGRPICAETFRLDSEDVDYLVTELLRAKHEVQSLYRRCPPTAPPSPPACRPEPSGSSKRDPRHKGASVKNEAARQWQDVKYVRDALMMLARSMLSPGQIDPKMSPMQLAMRMYIQYDARDSSRRGDSLNL